MSLATDTKFRAQLRILRNIDIHITGPGTGQFYQTFLPDGSVTINLGMLGKYEHRGKIPWYASFLEQYVAAGTPYIKGLYYPINERFKGIKKNEVAKLIEKAGQLILSGFSIPVNPRDNLAADGQLFIEMCEKDKEFCSWATLRTVERGIYCNNILLSLIHI